MPAISARLNASCTLLMNLPCASRLAIRVIIYVPWPEVVICRGAHHDGPENNRTGPASQSGGVCDGPTTRFR